MKKLFNKYRAKLVRLSESVAGVIIGYSDTHLILLLEEGVNPIYSFSLDDLAEEEFYIDFELMGDCETCLLSWVDESNIINGKKRTNNKTLSEESN